MRSENVGKVFASAAAKSVLASVPTSSVSRSQMRRNFSYCVRRGGYGPHVHCRYVVYSSICILIENAPIPCCVLLQMIHDFIHFYRIKANNAHNAVDGNATLCVCKSLKKQLPPSFLYAPKHARGKRGALVGASTKFLQRKPHFLASFARRA